MKLFSLAYRLAFRGKWLTKFLTVLLSAASFAFFALASTGFTYSESDYYIRGYQSYLQQHSFLAFVKQQRAEYIDSDSVTRIENAVQADFVCSMHGYPIEWTAFVSDCYSEDEEVLHRAEQVLAANLDSDGGHVLAGTQEGFGAFGFQLLAGKYPEAENEIAIDVGVFRVFRECGYSDNCSNFLITPWSPVPYLDTEAEPNERITIAEYGDLLGKRLVCPDGRLVNTPPQAVIVGIFDRSDAAIPSESENFFPKSAIIRSKAWQRQVQDDRLQIIECMIAPLTPERTEYKAVQTYVDLTQEALAEGYEAAGGIAYELSPLFLKKTISFSREEDAFKMTDKDMIALLLSGAGAVLLVFSVLLNARLMTAMIGQKHKQIGVLRALGASRGKIFSIYLIGTLYLAAIIFLAALIATLGLFYGFLEPFTTFTAYGVSFLRLDVRNVLILAALSFAVPVLSVLLPIRRFFRNSISDNIRTPVAK